jgi:hypothetical protein
MFSLMNRPFSGAYAVWNRMGLKTINERVFAIRIGENEITANGIIIPVNTEETPKIG